MKHALFLVLVAACGRAASGTSGDDEHPGPDAAEVTIDGTTESPDAAIDAAVDAPPDAPPLPADFFALDPTKQPMPFSQLVTYFGAGQTTANVGGHQLRMRSRSACNDVTGCTPWIDPSSVTLMESGGAQRVPSASGTARLVLDTTSTPRKISIEFVGTPVRFTCGSAPQTGAIAWDCSSYGTNLLWFYDYYLGHPRLDNTTLIQWRGIIATDGTYQFVSRLASDLGTAVDGKNNLQQMAIVGTL